MLFPPKFFSNDALILDLKPFSNNNSASASISTLVSPILFLILSNLIFLLLVLLKSDPINKLNDEG